MTILSDLINNMKTDDLAWQVRELCDQIEVEESENMKHLAYGPKGPNIFLCLEVPGKTIHDVGFLTLERETEDLWMVVFWTVIRKNIDLEADPMETERPRKKKLHEVADHRPEKILTHYAKWYKFYKGE